MRGKTLRFTIGITAVLAALIYFGISGFQEGKAYYKTLEELNEMGGSAYGKQFKVAGYVSAGSIMGRGKTLTFKLEQNDLELAVRYTGSAPVPDTFKDGTEAVLEGTYHQDGTFEAKKIQAKCASKYESKYGKSRTEP